MRVLFFWRSTPLFSKSLVIVYAAEFKHMTCQLKLYEWCGFYSKIAISGIFGIFFRNFAHFTLATVMVWSKETLVVH